MIACDIHDYFEIVCMRKSQLKLTLHNQQIIEGQALDIKVFDRIEYIQLKRGRQHHMVALTDIQLLSAINNTIESHNFSLTISPKRK